MSEKLRDAALALPALVQEAEQLPVEERTRALRKVLRTQVHDPAMRATGSDAGPADLTDLAAAVRASVPDAVEDGMEPRLRVFVRLLRRDALEPAWTLAGDNASGVVAQATSGVSMWAGPTLVRQQLPLPTRIENGAAVFAWLPGFRDPRYDVPDDVYDLAADVGLYLRLDRARFDADRLALSGVAWITPFDAGEDDVVTVRLEADGRQVRVPATRTRSPEHVRELGPALTQLAWAGWRASVDLRALSERSADWLIRVEVARQGLRRSEPLGLTRGRLALHPLIAEPYESRRYAARLHKGEQGELTVQLRPVEGRTGLLPVAARSALRRVRPQAVPPPSW